MDWNFLPVYKLFTKSKQKSEFIRRRKKNFKKFHRGDSNTEPNTEPSVSEPKALPLCYQATLIRPSSCTL